MCIQFYELGGIFFLKEAHFQYLFHGVIQGLVGRKLLLQLSFKLLASLLPCNFFLFSKKINLIFI